MPSICAASATPCAWLPLENATTPRFARGCVELGEPVVRAAKLERAHALQVLGLEVNASRRVRSSSVARRDGRRAVRHAAQTLRRRRDVVERHREQRGQSLTVAAGSLYLKPHDLVVGIELDRLVHHRPCRTSRRIRGRGRRIVVGTVVSLDALQLAQRGERIGVAADDRVRDLRRRLGVLKSFRRPARSLFCSAAVICERSFRTCLVMRRRSRPR